jgi:hypothetical protein
MAGKTQTREIYQLKVTLEVIRPPIWRRLQVPAGITLAQLHAIIQAAMGWWDYHLHQFTIGGQYFGVPHPDYDDYVEMHDEARVRLNHIIPGADFKFGYEYDFGDSWEHEILVEKVLEAEAGQNYPVCVRGRRACPPEDVGGFWGYAQFLEAMRDPNHPEHQSYTEWIGGEFDPEALDLDEINAALREL